MKGVILGICPRARIVDITHGIAPFRIAQGAYVLSQAWTTFPRGTIHVVVVDPGVGSDRRALLVEADGQYFVGPDNGLFSLVVENARSVTVREITADRYFRKPVSSTFHGRDVFAPVAAHLAKGVLPRRFGPVPGEPMRRLADGGGTVFHVDRFGNVVTGFRSRDYPLGELIRLVCGKVAIERRVTCFAEAPAGEPVMVDGSAGFIEVVVREGNASELLGLGADSGLHLTEVNRM